MIGTCKKAFVSLGIILISFFTFKINAQSTVDIFDGSSEDKMPADVFWEYTYSEMIILASDIGQNGLITGIQLEWDGYAGYSNENWEIYMAHSSKSSFSGATDWINTSSMTKVFDGTFNIPSSSGFFQINLDTEYSYTYDDNLIIAVKRKTGTDLSSLAEFYSVTGKTDRGLYIQSISDITTTSPGTGTLRDELPSLKLVMYETATWDGSSGTDWNTAANWDINRIPTDGLDVIIPNVANDPDISSGYSSNCNDLTINSGAILTFSSTSNGLNIYGDIQVDGTISHTGDQWIGLNKSSGGVLSGTGSQTSTTYAVNGDYILNNDWSIYRMNPSGSLTIGSGNTLSIAYRMYNTGTVTLSGTASMNVTNNLSAAATDGSSFTINSGTLDVDGELHANAGSGSGGTFNANSATIYAADDFKNWGNGTFNCGTSTIILDGSGNQDVQMNGQNTYNFTVNKSSEAADITSSTLNVTGDLTITQGTLNVSSNSLTVTGTTDNNGTISITTGTLDVNGDFDGTSGNLTCSGNSIINLGGTINTSLGTFTKSTSTLTFDRSGTQSIPSDTYYHLIIDGSNTKTLSGAINVDGNFTINNGTFTTSGFQINCAGNFTSNATLNEGSSTFEFDGNSNQDISGTDLEFHDLLINNSSGDIDLINSASINGSITLTTGDLNISTGVNLSIDDTDTPGISGGSASSHIITNGTATIIDTYSSTSKITYPLGDGSNYRPVALTPSSSSSQDWTISYSSSAHTDSDVDGSGLDRVSLQEYWEIDRNASVDAVLEFTWTSNNSIVDYTELEIAHYDGTTDWDMIDATPVGDNTSGTITSNSAVSTFSPFSLGSKSAVNLLPVDLVQFEISDHCEYTELNWVTASELNNDFFSLEKSHNRIHWETIYNVQGAGTSSEIHEYSYMDFSPTNQTTYYRLIQHDFDGKFEYFEQSFSPGNCHVQNILYPNPCNNEIYYSSEIETPQHYSIFNGQGKRIRQSETKGIIDVSNLSTGVYFLHLNNETYSFTKH